MDDFSSNNNYNYNNNNNNYYNNNPNGGGYYPDGEFRGAYRDNIEPERKGKGLAIAAFVIAIVNIIPCCTTLSIIAVPLSIIFAIISLVGKRQGTVFAVIGIVLSLLASLFFGYYAYIVYKIYPDMLYFVQNEEQITEDYETDGTIPERFEKYRDPKYDKYWKRQGFDSFDEFFGKFIDTYRNSGTYSDKFSENHKDSSDDDSGTQLALFSPKLCFE